MRKDELVGKLEEAEVDLRSPKIPTIALKLRVVNGRALNAYPVSLLPTEKEADGFGFGHLPLLEAVGSEEPRLPESNDVEEQLCLFLRSLATTNNVAVHRLNAMLSPGNFPERSTGGLPFTWPEYRGPLSGSSTRNVAGVCHSFIFTLYISNARCFCKASHS